MIARPRATARRLVATAALTTALLGTTAARAFVRTTTEAGAQVSWPDPRLTLVVRTTEPPANLTPEMAETAAREAAATWSAPQIPCTTLNLQVTVDGPTDALAVNDGQNNLFFRKPWCKDPTNGANCYDPQALAITTVFAYKNDGTIQDADVEINATDFNWGDLVEHMGATGNAADLQNTLTHEFGHFIGLDHTCYSTGDRHRATDQTGALVPDCGHAPFSVRETTMFASVVRTDIDRRTLTDDDIAGACAIYPIDRGGCALAAGPASGSGSLAALLLVGLAGIATHLRARRRRG
jgi:hypothetical protein